MAIEPDDILNEIEEPQFDWVERIYDVLETALAGLPLPPPGMGTVIIGIEFDSEEDLIRYIEWETIE